MGERDNQQKDPAKHHSSLASQASLSGREGSPSSVLVGSRVAVGAVGTRRHRPLALAIWQAAAAFLPALFYRFRVPLSSCFF